jgi:hypothetical protein
MKLRMEVVSTGAAAVLMALALGGAPMTALAAPQLTIQSEQAAHPRIAKALHEMQDALKALEEAPIDFGGNKAAAIKDLHAAIRSLKKALYFRLKMDDEAIEKAQ